MLCDTCWRTRPGATQHLVITWQVDVTNSWPWQALTATAPPECSNMFARCRPVCIESTLSSSSRRRRPMSKPPLRLTLRPSTWIRRRYGHTFCKLTPGCTARLPANRPKMDLLWACPWGAHSRPSLTHATAMYAWVHAHLDVVIAERCIAQCACVGLRRRMIFLPRYSTCSEHAPLRFLECSSRRSNRAW